MKKISKFVNDLGTAAYLLMHKYKIITKKEKSFYFELSEIEEQEFDNLNIEYLSSEFHQFDSCLMSLKKMTDHSVNLQRNYKEINDLGIAAYLMMRGYKVLGKKNKFIYFDLTNKKEKDANQLIVDYLCSEFHRFDSCLMALKKIGDYVLN
jgi:hypothetical protein